MLLILVFFVSSVSFAAELPEIPESPAAEVTGELSGEEPEEEVTEEQEDAPAEEESEESEETGEPEETEPEESEIEEPEVTESEEPETDSDESEPAPQAKLEYEDDNYKVTAEGPFPEGTVLDVRRLEEEELTEYVRSAEEELELEVSSLHLMDISFIYEGEKIEPEGLVDVRITCRSEVPVENGDDVRILHFADEKPEIVEADASVEDKNLKDVSFASDSFSVYAIVEVADPGPSAETSLFEGDEPDGKRLIIGNTRNNTTGYLLASVKNATWMNQTNDINAGHVWTFTKITGGAHDGQYTIKGTKYLKLAGGKLSLSDDPDYFVLEKVNGKWIIKDDENSVNNCVNRNVTNGFTAWKDGYGDAGNRIDLYAVPESPTEGDALGLGGKTYGIVNYKNGTRGIGMTSEVAKQTRLKGLSLLVRQNPMDRSSILLDGLGSDIAFFTFESLGGDKYRLSCNGKYLSIDGAAVALVDTPDDTTNLTITAGTGANAGKVRITNRDGQAINLYSGSASEGFGGYSDNGVNEWHYLVDLSDIQEENYVTYTAKKVSVADTENVTNGTEVIVYTRFWNSSTKEYEFYAIDHDGTLFRVYENGDTIKWVGVEFNTPLWEFTEYYYEGTDRPNYYYELQNSYSGRYLAPQIGQTLSASPIGINLNGRRYGDYFSPILAWDSSYYDYAGLTMNNNKDLEGVSMANASDFYFAIMEKPSENHTTIDTVNNDEHGITMKLFDYSGAFSNAKKDRLKVQTDIMGTDTYVRPVTQGLVSRNLSDGAPVATLTDESLGPLFSSSADVAEYDANHLFSDALYGETGYFQYNCFDNYAYFDQSSGNFTVYDALGSPSGRTDMAAQRGNFLPFNDLTNTPRSDVTNMYNGEGALLEPDDPKYGQPIYEIDPPGTNYFFGMSLEASFMQSESGTDAWGHDVIFEFYGDDDMWLYVDDVLVLDLGGIHDAHHGKVNFRTGEVYVEGPGATTLRNLFALALAEKNGWTMTSNTEAGIRSELDPSALSELDSYMAKYFDGESFKGYSAHTMKMFYMERGAGASNLKMKFNLSTVAPGSVLLKKEISGTDKADFSSVRFPYQIFYKDPEDNEYTLLTQRILSDGTSTFWAATYKGRKTRLPYDAHATINGVEYDNVFYLSPGEEAEIHLMNDEREYYIKEVGIDGSFYDEVSANGTVLTGVEKAQDIKDFSVPETTVAERKRVIYTNHVQDDKLKTLSVTKHLYREDYNDSRIDAHELRYPVNSSQTDPREYDDTTFTYRIYLGREEPDGDETEYYYRFGKYYVRDPNGNYCIYNNGFVSLGKTQFDDLTEQELSRATFRTSMNGMADSIPAGYTIEIRNLLSNTWFMIKEVNIPEGYSLLDNTDDPDDIDGYERSGGSYITGALPNTGWTRDNNASPHLDVNNRRGWGLEVTKNWTDKDFMETRDPVYVGLYYNGTLVEDTLREITDSQYYYFTRLPRGGDLSDYEFREIKITGTPVTDELGNVTNIGDLTLAPLSEGSTISVGGKMKGFEASSYNYKVRYHKGTPGGTNANSRKDVITNSRPGIRVVKTDWSGTPLSGAEFSLEGENGPAGKGKYTSSSNGSVAILYPNNGETLTLTETKAPEGHLGTTGEISIGLNNSVAVVTGGGDYVVTTGPDNEMLATVTIKNRPYSLSAVKVDAMNGNAPMSGVRFALYRELKTSTGDYMKDYNPLPGYEELISDEDGIIPQIDNTLPPGTYYLSEITAPAGYNKMGDLRFTVQSSGEVTSTNQLLTTTYDQDGTCNFRITVPNTKGYELNITKIWTNGVSNISWPVDSNGDDIPLYFTLKRKLNDTEDQGFSKTLKATSDSLVFTAGHDSSVITMVSGNAASGFRMSIVGLPEKSGNTPYVYYFEEAPVQGFETKYYNGSVETQDLLDGYTVTNIQKAILIQKFEEGSETIKLEKAEFEIYTNASLTEKATDIFGSEIGTIITDRNGYGSLGILPDGVYYLKETKAPAGYVPIPDPVVITVGNDVTYSVNGNTKTAVKDGEQYFIKLYDERMFHIIPTGISPVKAILIVVILVLMGALRGSRRGAKSCN